jgi:hypothetical protein
VGFPIASCLCNNGPVNIVLGLCRPSSSLSFALIFFLFFFSGRMRTGTLKNGIGCEKLSEKTDPKIFMNSMSYLNRFQGETTRNVPTHLCELTVFNPFVTPVASFRATYKGGHRCDERVKF